MVELINGFVVNFELLLKVKLIIGTNFLIIVTVLSFISYRLIVYQLPSYRLQLPSYRLVTVLSFTLRVKFVLAYQQLRSTIFYTACTSWISL